MVALDSINTSVLSKRIYIGVISVYVITHRLCEPTLPD